MILLVSPVCFLFLSPRDSFWLTVNADARAVFETFVGKAPAQKTKKIYQYFYEYEAHYGDLNQVYKLEKRMSELFPGGP